VTALPDDEYTPLDPHERRFIFRLFTAIALVWAASIAAILQHCTAP
jgi:hypothetical protein